MAGNIKTVSVTTESASYSYRVGTGIFDIDAVIDRVKEVDKAGIVISKRVYDLHQDYIKTGLPEMVPYSIFIMDDEEENKSFSYSELFLQKMVKEGFSRKSLLVGIGGGVVGDFTGFLASIYMRGVPVIHVPTTLLSMVDSSIGGKVAVNLSVGKNIVGAFHQPAAVSSDVTFLKTLPEEEWINGLAEILKHGLIGDERTLDLLEGLETSVIDREDLLIEIIFASAAFKASIVALDEREGGIRAILNFGHTVGHALESILEFSGISHGEAVAAGMVVEIEISRKLGLLNQQETERITKLLDRFVPLKKLYDLDRQEIFNHMKFDKKNSAGRINFVLLEAVGKPLIDYNVDDEIIIEALKLITKK